MLTAFLTVFAALAAAGLVIMLVAARRAPVGYEDANGFHVVGEATTRPSHAMMAAPVRVL